MVGTIVSPSSSLHDTPTRNEVTSAPFYRAGYRGQMPASHPTLPKDRKHRDSAPRQASRRGSADEWTLVEFRPARWLVSALTLLALWLGGAKLGKRGLLALAWRFAPRRVRLVAGGVAAVALVVLVGSVAALALALTQLV
jgi:hypothetical protein